MTEASLLGVCVIGTGRAGMIHARNFCFGRVAQAALVGIVEPAEPARQAARQKLRLEQVYADYRQALADQRIDAVVVATPSEHHCAIVVAAAAAGKHVLCEKPLALSIGEVDRIAAAAGRSDRLVLEAFMYRHAPRWRRAVELVAGGAIGRPRIVRVGFAFFVPTDLANIRFVPAAGGGIIWDMGCYASSMARGMLGTEPIEVVGLADVREGQPTETTVTGVMRFPHQAAAPFWVSFDFHNPYAQAEVVGTDGWLTLPGTGMRGEPFTRLLLHQGAGEIYADGVEPTEERFPFADPYRLEVEHLAGAIRGRFPLQFSLDDARANTAVLEAMHASVARNAPVGVAEFTG